MKRIISLLLVLTLLLSTVCLGDDLWNCPSCGAQGQNTNFCIMCGTKRPDNQSDIWTCPSCGREGLTDNFCGSCGTKRPEQASDTWSCANCGYDGNTDTDLFCIRCGTKRQSETVQVVKQPAAQWQGLLENINYSVYDDMIMFFDDGGCPSDDEFVNEVTRVIEDYMSRFDTEGTVLYVRSEQQQFESKETIKTACLSNGVKPAGSINFGDYAFTSSLRESLLQNKYESGFPIYLLFDHENDETITLVVAGRVRSNPGLNGSVIGELSAGSTVKCYGLVNSKDGSGSWYEIDYYGQKGYIAASTTDAAKDRTTTTQGQSKPTSKPTATPTPMSTFTSKPTAAPTTEPTIAPTVEPTIAPTEEPTATPHVHIFKYTTFLSFRNGSHTPVCNECGYKGKAERHTLTYVYNDMNSHTVSCSVCGSSAHEDHSKVCWSIPGDSGSHKVVCDYCGHEFGIEKHSYKSVKSDVYPYDYMYSYCTKCGFRQ